MLNRIGESGYPCLVPYLGTKAFSLSSLMLAVSLSCMTPVMYSLSCMAYVEKCSLYALNLLRVPIMNGC